MERSWTPWGVEQHPWPRPDTSQASLGGKIAPSADPWPRPGGRVSLPCEIWASPLCLTAKGFPPVPFNVRPPGAWFTSQQRLPRGSGAQGLFLSAGWLRASCPASLCRLQSDRWRKPQAEHPRPPPLPPRGQTRGPNRRRPLTAARPGRRCPGAAAPAGCRRHRERGHREPPGAAARCG